MDAAFESMEHSDVVAGWQKLQVPAVLIAARCLVLLSKLSLEGFGVSLMSCMTWSRVVVLAM